MKLLVLGGTEFLGRHIVDAALEQNHDVVLFNRGRTNPQLYPHLDRVVGDRDGGIPLLKGRKFDAVIDTSGYVPRVVRQSAKLLSEASDFYAFISSISVYPDATPAAYTESAPTRELENAGSENVQADYGALKAACERVVEDAFPDRCLLVRAGLIVGPHDPTGRFTYWVSRTAAGGDVLAPAPPEAPVQMIDARDLAAWTVRMTVEAAPGVFNATGPGQRLSMGDLLKECARATGGRARFTWVDPGFLLERNVRPWSELPLWLPGEEDQGMLQADIGKAKAAGLRFRPLDDTVRDIRDWLAGPTRAARGEAGMEAGREAELLEEWRTAS